MARNTPNDLSVVGFEADTQVELADKIQTEFIDQHVDKNHLNIAERYFFQPAYEGGKYSTLIFYSLTEKEQPAEAPATEETADEPPKTPEA